jgi:hypothetical protein
MEVRPASLNDTASWLAMRNALRPDENGTSHPTEIQQHFAGTLRPPLEVLLAVSVSGVCVGLVER